MEKFALPAHDVYTYLYFYVCIHHCSLVEINVRHCKVSEGAVERERERKKYFVL